MMIIITIYYYYYSIYYYEKGASVLATCYVLMGVSLTFTFMLIILFCTVMVKYMSVCLYVCLSDSDMVLTAQTARLLIDCVECRKQRVSYYRRRLL